MTLAVFYAVGVAAFSLLWFWELCREREKLRRRRAKLTAQDPHPREHVAPWRYPDPELMAGCMAIAEKCAKEGIARDLAARAVQAGVQQAEANAWLASRNCIQCGKESPLFALCSERCALAYELIAASRKAPA